MFVLNKPERPEKDIYDDSNLKKPFGLQDIQKKSAL